MWTVVPSATGGGHVLFRGESMPVRDARLYGAIGKPLWELNPMGTPAVDAEAPAGWEQYYEVVDVADGDGSRRESRLRPEFAQRLGDRTQVNSLGYGGPGELIDPNLLEYDEMFGVVTPTSNLRVDPGHGMSGFLQNYLPYLAAGGVLGAVGAVGGLSGLSGLLGGAGSTGLGSYGAMTTGLDGLTGTLVGESLAGAGANLGAYGGMTTGLDGLSSASLTAGGGADGIASATQALTGGGSAPWYSTLLQNAQSNLSNPMMAARGLMGAAQLANSLANRGSGNNGSVSTTGSDMNPLLNLPTFNPLGLLANYKPREIKPIPFMTGTGLL